VDRSLFYGIVFQHSPTGFDDILLLIQDKRDNFRIIQKDIDQVLGPDLGEEDQLCRLFSRERQCFEGKRLRSFKVGSIVPCDICQMELLFGIRKR
jgi:hypothetical protein